MGEGVAAATALVARHLTTVDLAGAVVAMAVAAVAGVVTIMAAGAALVTVSREEKTKVLMTYQ